MEAAVRFGVRVKSVATAAKMGTGLIITRRVIPPPSTALLSALGFSVGQGRLSSSALKEATGG